MLEGIRFSVYKKDCPLHIVLFIFLWYIKELFNLKPSKYKELFNILSQPCMESNFSQY